MTRHSFTNSGCCHAWAHQTSDYGNGSHRRIYFDGPLLYSYGTHFLIAALLPGGLALFNSARWSVSTSQHQSYAKDAARHLARFTIPDPANLFYMFQTTGILARLEAQADGKRPPPWSNEISPPVWRADGESPLEAARQQVRRYVVKHAQELDGLRESLPFRASYERAAYAPDAAPETEARLFPVWLLGLVGLGESTWRKILDTDTRQRLRTKQKAARQGLANDIRDARKAAARTDSEFADVLRRNCDFILSGVTC